MCFNHSMFFLDYTITKNTKIVSYNIIPEHINVSASVLTLPNNILTSNIFKNIKNKDFAFIDATAIDNLEQKRRFALIYNLFNYITNTRTTIRQYLRLIDTPQTVSDCYLAADFAEREIFDMFGIIFVGHKDLRRILTDYSFRGNPLKKDFPTTGYNQVSYSIEQKSLITQPLRLLQTFREPTHNQSWSENVSLRLQNK